jgi:hypothetical protein
MMPTLLKRTSKKSETRLVGAHVPLPAYNLLSLYTIAEGISKSELLKILIDQWVSDKRKTRAETELIGIIAQRVAESWEEMKQKHARMTLPMYLQLLKKDLIYKGVTEVQVNKIIAKANHIWKDTESN